MSAPRYTSAGQFANMLERRAQELAELAARIKDHGGSYAEGAAECIHDARDDLARAVEKLRERVSE